jgi:hypothetical protein
MNFQHRLGSPVVAKIIYQRDHTGTGISVAWSLWNFQDCLFASRGLANYVQSQLLSKEGANCVPHDGMVFHHEHYVCFMLLPIQQNPSNNLTHETFTPL